MFMVSYANDFFTSVAHPPSVATYTMIFFAGSWKRKCHAKFMIFTQCLSLTIFNNQYLTNIMLKINAEVSFLAA